MRKIKNMLEDKTGVSPIIAIILMVAITVVLAATIYVWVSGFGGGGDKTPSLSCAPDNADDVLRVTACDDGVSWSDINITVTLANGTTEYISNTGTVTAGDEIDLSSGYGTGMVTVQLRYDPTNALIGTWTVNI
jgi:flagellin-like protein